MYLENVMEAGLPLSISFSAFMQHVYMAEQSCSWCIRATALCSDLILLKTHFYVCLQYIIESNYMATAH